MSGPRPAKPDSGLRTRCFGAPTVTSYRRVVQRVFGFVGGHASVSSVVRGAAWVLYVRREAGGRVYVCDGGRFGGVSLCEAATDRGPVRADRPLTLEVLIDLVALLVAITGGREES